MSTTKIKVSNIASVTGTGNVVLSSSPTFTGTTATANVSYSGTLTGSTGILNIGSGQLYKDGSGNVGIGTSSPQAKEHIAVNTSVITETLRLDNIFNTGDNGNKITWYNAAQTPEAANISGFRIGATTGFGLSFSTSSNFATTAAVERMRIDSSGNVGIGTSSPAARLHAYGSTTNASIIRTELGGGADGVYFEIKGGVNYRSLTASTSAGAIDWAVGQYGTATGQNLAFYTGTTERMRIDSSGKVGINVTPSASTSAKLQVTGGTTNATTLATSYSTAVVAYVPKSSSGYSLAIASGTSDLPQLQVSANGTASGDLLIQPYGGNVGIGTSSPAAKLQVNGRFGLFDNSQTVPTPDNASVPVFVMSGNFSSGSGETSLWNTAATLTGGIRLSQVTGSGTYNDMAWFQKNLALFYTANTERMRIDSSGNVGIGTSSPVAKLTVAGDSFLGYTGSSGILIRSGSGVNRIDSYNYPITANYPLAILGSYITLNTSDAERLRIDASGNVGIGTSSPICKLNVYSSTAQNDTYGFVQIENPTAAAGVNASYTAKNYSGTSQFMQWENYGLRIGSRIVTNTGLGNIIFTTGNDAERMRIDANGYLLKNTSAFISTSYGNGDFSLVTMSAGLVIKNPGASGAAVPTSIVFLNGAGTAVGYIAVGASVTNFTNLSDYRLKKDVTQINNALDKVSRINPVSFIWKESGEVGESFIAHELQEECPIAVVGNKDDVNEDGSIRPQGVDASKLIPLLTAAIKELKTIIDTQQEQINIQQQQINTLLGE